MLHKRFQWDSQFLPVFDVGVCVCVVYKKLWVCSATYGAQIAISSSRGFRSSGLGRLWDNEPPPLPPEPPVSRKYAFLINGKLIFYVHTGSCNRIYEPLKISFSIYMCHIPCNIFVRSVRSNGTYCINFISAPVILFLRSILWNLVADIEGGTQAEGVWK
jgi:hypothetical protein